MTYTPEAKISHIKYWYDRNYRLWAVARYDSEDNQLGDCEWEPTVDRALMLTVGINSTLDAAVPVIKDKPVSI